MPRTPSRSLRPVSYAANLFVSLPEVPRYTETADLILTRQLGKSLTAELGNARAVFLVNHGIVAVGDAVESATVAAPARWSALRRTATG